jgi:hypothetical protein
VLAVLLLAGNTARSQNREALLLPHPVHISVTAVDDAGKPIDAAQVANTGDPTRLILTAAGGHVQLTTRAPVIVIRKIGYRSATIRPSESLQTTVTLHRMGNTGDLPACQSGEHLVGLGGWEARFRFERSDFVVPAGKSRKDVDYGAQLFVLRQLPNKPALEQASGPMWGNGEPGDQQVWSSIAYEEAVFRDSSGQPVIRAHGKGRNGQYWGMLGHFMETADYTGADQPTAQAFEQFLDHVCELKQPARNP